MRGAYLTNEDIPWLLYAVFTGRFGVPARAGGSERCDVSENPPTSVSVTCEQKVRGSFTLRAAPERVLGGWILHQRRTH